MGTSETAQTDEPGAAEDIQLRDIEPAVNGTSKRRHMPNLKSLHESPCRRYCHNLCFLVLAIFPVLLSITVIVITVMTSIATKVYDNEQSNRLVAMVILAVTGAVTISIIIYAVVAVFRKHAKPLHATAIVLIIVAVIQALIAGLSVNVTEKDEMNLGKSLADSFKLAKEDNPRHVKLWATTQADLQCCGVYGPEDYRARHMPHYFPPNIPITCCPTYNSDRSELVQEREREICKAKKSFYDVGCRSLILGVFKETSAAVLSVTVCLIVFELLLSLTGAFLSKRIEAKPDEDTDEK